MPSRAPRSTTLGAVALVVLLSGPAHANDGDFDPSWGIEGRLLVDLGQYDDVGQSMLVQPDGKIVMTGTCGSLRDGAPYNTICAARLRADGQPDTSFGPNGSGHILLGDSPNSPLSSSSSTPRGLALQADGRIVLASIGFHFCTAGSLTSSAFERLSASGALETSGGQSCWPIEFLPNGGSAVKAITIQPDGKIVAVGRASPTFDGAVFGIARYNPDFSLDTSFASGGQLVVDWPLAGVYSGSEANAVVAQPDGKIVVAGKAIDANHQYVAAVLRLNADGSLDDGFGSGGKIWFGCGGSTPTNGAWINAVKLDTQGRIYAVGTCDVGTDSRPDDTDFLSARLTADGELDSTWGRGLDGTSGTDFGNNTDEAYDLVVQPDGKTIFVGASSYSSVGSYFVLVRYTADGTQIDLGFGNQGGAGGFFAPPGQVTTGKSIAYAATIVGNGLLVAGSGVVQDGGAHFGLAKLVLNDLIFRDGFDPDR